MANSKERAIFGYLLSVLPLHAEEDSVREEMPESEIVQKIESIENNISMDVATFVKLMGEIFQSLTLVDEAKFQNNIWTFVSFPATLLARSILESLSNSETRFFRNDFWEQGNKRPENEVEFQRKLIRNLEVQRTHNSEIDHHTIRTVHVAWGVIRLGSCFLLCKREDKERPGIGGFTFPGGRFNFNDLPNDEKSPNNLSGLFKINSEIVEKNIPKTLYREMEEETGLFDGKDYEEKFIITLPKFCKIEGAKNNHAYTQYNIAMFSIRLTLEGELKLLDRVANNPEDYKWFTLQNLIKGDLPDGSKAFVEALVTSKENAEMYLKSFEDSSSTTYEYNKEESSIELPSSHDRPFKKGKAGKQNSIDVDLTPYEWGFLMLLGWHSRGLDIQIKPSLLHLMGGGWIKIIDKDLTALLKGIVDKIDSELPRVIELNNMGFCRLSVKPQFLYFSPECFEYRWEYENDEKPIVITLKQIKNEIGVLTSKHVTVNLTPSLKKAMPFLEEEKEPDNVDTVIRQFSEKFKLVKENLGLHQFIKTVGNSIECIVVPRS